MDKPLEPILNLADQAPPPVTFTVDEVISPYIWVLYVAFLVALLFTPIMRALALKNGIVDWPDLKRKAHVEPVAYLGGVAVFLGWLAGVVACFFIDPHYLERLDTISSSDLPAYLRDYLPSVKFPISILFGAMLITLVGLFDDIYGISPRVKVGGQLLAAAALASQTIGTKLAAGIITSLAHALNFEPTIIPGFGSEIYWQDPSYWLGAIMVAVLVLGGCNAANLMDGLDGLASGVTGIVALGFGTMAVCLAMGLYPPGGIYSWEYDPVRIVMCLALLGAVLGFLPYNFNPASIFMGDAGSMLLGYLCMSTVLLFGERGDPILAMAALMVFGLPMVDTALAIVRRKARGQPIFSADNQHLHHQLIRSGLSVKQAVGWLYIMAIGFAGLGVAMIFFRLRYVALLFIVVVAFVTVTAFKVGHRQLLAMQAAEAEKNKDSRTDDAEPDIDPAAPESREPAPEA